MQPCLQKTRIWYGTGHQAGIKDPFDNLCELLKNVTNAFDDKAFSKRENINWMKSEAGKGKICKCRKSFDEGEQEVEKQ